MIHVVGHELRTPVTTVRGLAELMATASDEEIRDTLVPALLRNARRAERLLDDLLLAGRGRHRASRPNRRASSTSPRSSPRPPPASPSGSTDGRQLGCSPTAIRSCEPWATSSPTPTATARPDPGSTSRTTPTAVTVVVVTPVDGAVADLDLVFELFFRGEAAVTRAPGLGVGLAAAKALAQVDGGDVTIAQIDADRIETRLRLPRAS